MKIGIIRMGRMGDMILTLPIIQSIKSIDSSIKIHVFASSRNVQVIQSFKYIDRIFNINDENKLNKEKYDLIEEGIEFSDKTTSGGFLDLSDPIPIPLALKITEELYKDSRNKLKNRATFSWEAPTSYPYVSGYYVEWQKSGNSNWISLGETTATSITINDAPAGSIEFRVKTKRAFG